MTDERLAFMVPNDSSDGRGPSFSLTLEQLSALRSIQDVHIAAIAPGAIRGNHYHLIRGELITVVHEGLVSVHWDTGPDTRTACRSFAGPGSFAFAPPLGWSHAVRNDGDVTAWIFVASDRPYNRADTSEVARDAYRRVVTD